MTYDELEELEFKLEKTMEKNRERIDKLSGYAMLRDMRDCPESKWIDMWMNWQDELWNRINWQSSLKFYAGVIRKELHTFEFDPSNIKWTLDDYVYSK